MTRFARAKGSKASNEKAPEDGTPWEVMKQQLIQSKKDNEEAKKREEVEQQRIENYQNFLKDQKVQKRKATWCDFPGTAVEKKSKPTPSLQLLKPKSVDHVNVETNELKSNKKHKKKKNKQEEIPKTGDPIIGDLQKVKPALEIASKKIKKKKKKNKHSQEEQKENPSNEKSVKETHELQNTSTSDYNEPIKSQNNEFNQVNKSQDKKKKKQKGIKPNRRKPIDDNSFRLIINGKDVDLVRFDGFPIMKKDAERLTELRKEMIRKGIPKSEVQRNMKLERRRAEKALARLKRDVCYNCRKGGHNLSDCPDLKSKIPGVDAADGLCFKCGSTEHRQFECKVQRDKEFRFASCFICKEQGHIARQCPDNPKGLYPNGGCCKLCGDVTHLRKDCPTVHDKKEETSVKLQTLHDDGNLEEMPEKSKSAPAEPAVKKPKKIKF